ncbi:hypothetical protein BDZ89DRAFT_1153422 [Hymenopellis radicata]|nr:hypothetical protein BDZ89DRAFT_1153422 [Hymenopellis radicata]
MSTVNQAVNPNPTTPVYTSDLQWITAYLTIHMMSDNSRRYIYIFWLCIGAVFLAFSFLHLTGMSGGTLGAYWMKWSIRRRTWRGKHFVQSRQKGGRLYPISLPPNGQLLALFLLPLTTLLLAFLGPDYISPANALFDVTNPGLTPVHHLQGLVDARRPSGLIAFAMFPLCVLFALKAPPFAIFALPFTTQIHFDKLSWLHRWTGRLIYLITLLHVAFWSIQLLNDRRPRDGKIAYTYAWQYEKFIYGWVAFLCMTLLVILSLPPVRRDHYEAFYGLHVLLVPLTLVVSSLHHPPVWMWCWIALALWAGERVWRGTWWLYINGIFGRDTTSAPAYVKPPTHRTVAPENMSLRPSQYEEPGGYPPPSPFVSNAFSQTSKLMEPATALKYSPPSGYAHAELLSGATIRLTYISPRYFSWAPGQHFLINIPSVSKVLSHPFTTASICDEEAPSDSGRAIVFLVRSRRGWTRDLWDFVLQLVSRGENHVPGEKPPNGTVMPNHGVLLRMFVDGPFGSAVRAKWESHSTVIIFVAGSGVSFGLSVLEYVCLCLAGRDGRHLGGRAGGWGKRGFATRRVRVVWLIREFAHIQWCASIMRRCMEMIPSPGLHVDIFVTNAQPVIREPPTYTRHSNAVSTGQDILDLPPPAPIFSFNRPRPSSPVSSESETEEDLGYYSGPFGDEMDITGASREDYALDLTNFDGDNDFTLPGEALLNMRVQRVGRDRRAHSRRFSKVKEDDFGRTSRMSSLSAEGLLSSKWKPARSKTMSIGSTIDEGDVGVAYLQDSWHEDPTRSPPSTSHHSLPHTGSPPRVQSRPATPVLHIPPTPSLTRPSSPPSLGLHDTKIPPAGQSATSFGGDTLMLEDGNTMKTLHLQGDEMRDISFVAERARPGRPKLDRILKDEVDRSNGSVIVACCGPTSFSAMVRRAIAFQIDPKRIRRGDRRGHIELISEEFEY